MEGKSHIVRPLLIRRHGIGHCAQGCCRLFLACLQAMQEIGGALRMGGDLKDRAIVVLQDFQPRRDVTT